MSAETRALANERMTMSEALRRAGTEAFDGYTGKVYCPFGSTMHADGGATKAMRNYGDHAFCFAGCGSFTPVKVIAMAEDISTDEAADRILEWTGYVAPTWQARLDAVLTRKQEVDTEALGMMLREECRRIAPDFERRQFEPHVAQALSRCLELLPNIETPTEAKTWRKGVVAVMTHVLETPHDETV